MTEYIREIVERLKSIQDSTERRASVDQGDTTVNLTRATTDTAGTEDTVSRTVGDGVARCRTSSARFSQAVHPIQAFFDVTIDSTNSPVTGGDTLTVNYSVENTGNADGTQTITLEIDSTQEDSESQTLTFKTATSSTLQWATQSGDAGTFTATVASDDDSDSTTVAVGDTTTVVDDFEDGNITEYGGDTGAFQTVTSPACATGSSAALEGTSDGSTAQRIFSTSGLNAYPQPGDTIEFCFNPQDSESQVGFFYGHSSAVVTDDGYEWFYAPTANAMQLFRADNGSFTKLGETTVTVTPGEFHRVTIDWGVGGGHTLTLFESDGTQSGQFTVTDSAYSNQGIGFSANGSAFATGNVATVFDDVVLL